MKPRWKRLWGSMLWRLDRWWQDHTHSTGFVRPSQPPPPWWWNQRCCDKAKQGPNCVCSFNTICPDHGERHHGTHD